MCFFLSSVAFSWAIFVFWSLLISLSRDDWTTYTNADFLDVWSVLPSNEGRFCQSNHQTGHTDNFYKIHWSILSKFILSWATHISCQWKNQEIEEPLLKCFKKQYMYKNEIKFYIYYFVIYSGNLLNLYIASHCFFSASIVCRCWDMTRCVKASLRLVFTFICIPPAMT